MGSKLSDIRQTVRQLLKDEFAAGTDQDWLDDELDVHIRTCILEISGKSPYRAFEPVPVTANSLLLDIGGIEDVVRVLHIEYEPGDNPRNFHNFESIDNETIEMDIDSAPSTGGSSGTLAGTVTFTAGSASVTGAGTAFSTALEADDYIKPSGGDRWYRVYSVESDTALTLDEAVKTGDSGADTVSLTQYRKKVALVYYDRLHKLTEEKSTLNPREESVLILGVCGQAAISKSKSLINSINTGGGDVPIKMQNWGMNKLIMYRQELNRLKPPQVKKTYY